MILNPNLVQLLIFTFLVILFPFVQKQWLNLSLFDLNNFSFYTLLYYLSGLLCPVLLILNSIKRFTYYKLPKINTNKNNQITGISLFFLVLAILISFSSLVYIYLKFTIDFLCDLFNNNNLFTIDFNKQLLLIFIISIFLLFKQTKVIIKKFILIIFFIFSSLIWYSEVNNIIINNDLIIISNFTFTNYNFINIIFMIFMEIFFYLWSYISYNTNLSDWIIPIPVKTDFIPLIKIIFIYLSILLYYYILE